MPYQSKTFAEFLISRFPTQTFEQIDKLGGMLAGLVSPPQT
jgi:hypothetical protein